MNNRKYFPYLRWFTYLASAAPLTLMIFDFVQGNYGADPVREFTLRTGKTAIILLLFTLACTPINIIFGYKQVLKLRRPLGLFSFLYAAIHFLIYIGADYFFDIRAILDALLDAGYPVMGLLAGTILLLLAATSFDFSKRLLKKWWKRLHSLVYLAGGLAMIHFIWLVKPGILRPWLYSAVFGILMLLRVKPVARFFGNGTRLRQIFRKPRQQVSA